MDRPLQRAFSKKMESLSFEDDIVKFAISSIYFSYEGRLDGEKITGTMLQGGVSLPLVMSRKKNPKKLSSVKQFEDIPIRIKNQNNKGVILDALYSKLLVKRQR